MKKILIVSALFILGSCVSSRIKLINSGEVKQEDFFKIMSFELKGTLPIVTVEINGQKATCLFDTGAPNVVTPELAAKLNLKTKSEVNIKDSGGKKAVQEFVLLDSINMDGIVFEDVAAVIVDLGANDAIKCMGIDGIIGANLMRLAYWEIDYQKKSLTFSNEISNLSDTSSMSTLKFKPTLTGTPKVSLKLNGHIVPNITFDTGSNGHLTVPKKEIKQVSSYSDEEKVVSVVGSNSFGVFGLAKSDTSYYRLIDSVEVAGGLQLESTILEFRGSATLLGTKLLKNYTTVLDWNSNNIYLKEVKSYQWDSMKNFGFSFLFKDKQMLIGAITLDTEAAESLQIGDQILSINEFDYNQVEEEIYCPMMADKLNFDIYGDHVKMKIKRGEETFQVELHKVDHFK